MKDLSTKGCVKKTALNACGVITAMAGMLLLIYIAFFSAVMRPEFLKDVNVKLGIHTKLGMSEADLEQVVNSMVYFTTGRQDSLQVRVVMNGIEQNFYNEKEIAHIEDVRELVQKVRVCMVGCVVIFVSGVILLLYKKEAVRLAAGFLIDLGIVLLAALAVAIVAVIDMQAVVNGFHYLFFDNDLWWLDYKTDMVVWLFTNDMYGDAIVRIGIWLGGLLVPFTVLSVLAVRRQRLKNKKKIMEQ